MDEVLYTDYVAVLDKLERLCRDLEKGEQWGLLTDAEAIKAQLASLEGELKYAVYCKQSFNHRDKMGKDRKV